MHHCKGVFCGFGEIILVWVIRSCGEGETIERFEDLQQG